MWNRDRYKNREYQKKDDFQIKYINRNRRNWKKIVTKESNIKCWNKKTKKEANRRQKTAGTKFLLEKNLSLGNQQN